MSCTRLICVAVTVLFLANVAWAADESQPATQPASKPTLSAADVKWWAHCDLEDGRRLITDGGLLIEARCLPKVPVPEKEIPATAAQRLLQSKTEREFGLDDLSKSGPDGHYKLRDSVVLNRKYVELLKDSSLAKTLRFRAKGIEDPVLILDDKKVVGVVMPVKQTEPAKSSSAKE